MVGARFARTSPTLGYWYKLHTLVGLLLILCVAEPASLFRAPNIGLREAWAGCPYKKPVIAGLLFRNHFKSRSSLLCLCSLLVHLSTFTFLSAHFRHLVRHCLDSTSTHTSASPPTAPTRLSTPQSSLKATFYLFKAPRNRHTDRRRPLYPHSGFPDKPPP
jgi:hypothetical protein